jgi:hypothetical protein
VYYVNFFYPQTLNLGGNYLYKPYLDDDLNTTKTFYNFSGFNYSNSTSVRFFDLTNSKLIKTTLTSTNVRVVVPNGNGRKNCVMVGDSLIYSVKSMARVNQTGYFTNYKIQTANKPFAIIYAQQLSSSSINYKNYRESSAGGNYNVLFGEINSLYEQFSYGVKQNPAVTRNLFKIP